MIMNFSFSPFCVRIFIEEIKDVTLEKKSLFSHMLFLFFFFKQLYRDKLTTAVMEHCYTSQLKFVFRLEENVSCVVGQNSLTPWGGENKTH